jgi:predicted PurR-regulated permease PerM
MARGSSEAALKSRARSAFPASVRVGIVGSFMILAIGALYYARSFFLPVVLAVLITLALAPMVRRLARLGIPPFASAALFIVALAAALAVASLAFTPAISSMFAEAPHIAKQVRDRFAFLQAPFTALNDIGRQFSEASENSQAAPQEPQPVVFMQPGLIGWLAGTAAGVGTTLGATLILSLFLLAQRDTLRLKLIRVMPDLHDKKRSLRVLRDIENEVSHYLLTITAINAGLGICVGLAMAWIGMPNAPLWGFGAALLNYVPFIGALAGECLALAVATVTFPTLAQALLPPLCYLAIQIVEANFVTPTVLGRRLELNPVAILIALALATWMWGIVGTILAVPMLVVIKVFCDNFETLFPLGEFLSASTAAEEDETPPDVPAEVTTPLPLEIISKETSS